MKSMSSVTSSPTRLPTLRARVERFQEHLGDDHGGAEVDEHAAMQLLADGGEPAEIGQAGGTDGRAVGTRVHVDDVGADRDVDGRRYAEADRRGENADATVPQLGVENRPADRRARAVGGAARDGAVEEAAGLLGPCRTRRWSARPRRLRTSRRDRRARSRE
jgi:hypothetical protein